MYRLRGWPHGNKLTSGNLKQVSGTEPQAHCWTATVGAGTLVLLIENTGTTGRPFLRKEDFLNPPRWSGNYYTTLPITLSSHRQSCFMEQALATMSRCAFFSRYIYSLVMTINSMISFFWPIKNESSLDCYSTPPLLGEWVSVTVCVSDGVWVK